MSRTTLWTSFLPYLHNVAEDNGFSFLTCCFDIYDYVILLLLYSYIIQHIFYFVECGKNVFCLNFYKQLPQQQALPYNRQFLECSFTIYLTSLHWLLYSATDFIRVNVALKMHLYVT